MHFELLQTLKIGVYTQKGRGHFGLIWQLGPFRFDVALHQRKYKNSGS